MFRAIRAKVDAVNEPQQRLVDIAAAIAVEAGQLIARGRAQAHVTAVKSASTDIVTQMDQASEALITERIAQMRPGDGILGEEGASVESSTGVTWIVDPIDGTVNYLYGLPHYAVSIAAVEGPPVPGEWTAVAGAVFDGAGRLWTAARGEGAWCDGARLEPRDGADLSQALVGTGFQYVAWQRAQQAATLARLMPHVRDVRRLGSASVDLCLVAAGQLDVYYEHGLNPWDYAAGALIAEETGLTVGGAHGRHASPDLLIAAPTSLFPAFHDALMTAGGERGWDTPEG